MKVPFITRNCPACSFPCHKPVHFLITHVVISHGCKCQPDKRPVQKTPGCCLWWVPGTWHLVEMRILQLVNAVADKQFLIEMSWRKRTERRSCLPSETVCTDEGALLFLFGVSVNCLMSQFILALCLCQCLLGAHPSGRGTEAHGADGG